MSGREAGGIPEDMLIDFVCTNRRYFAGRFLSPEKLCEGCPHELHGVFTTENGKQFKGYFCNYLLTTPETT